MVREAPPIEPIPEVPLVVGDISIRVGAARAIKPDSERGRAAVGGRVAAGDRRLIGRSAVDGDEVAEGIPGRPCIITGAVIAIGTIRDGAMNRAAIAGTVPRPALVAVAVIRQVVGFGARTPRPGEMTDVGSLCGNAARFSAGGVVLLCHTDSRQRRRVASAGRKGAGSSSRRQHLP